MKMVEKEKQITVKEKEVHKPTEQASITYERKQQDNFTKGVTEYIQIKDKTSCKAFETFKKLKRFVEKK